MTILLAAAWTTPAPAADPAPITDPGEVIGKATAVSGTVWQVRGAERMQLQAGSPLRLGYRVKTANGSEARLRINDAAMLVNANSDVEIRRVKDKDWKVDLTAGSLLSAVKNPEKRPNHFQVKTRTATMGVRGTVFFVHTHPKEDFLCTCIGTVNTRAADGSSDVTISSKHHDFPKRIEAGAGRINDRMKGAEMGEEHNDAEAAELARLLEANL